MKKKPRQRQFPNDRFKTVRKFMDGNGKVIHRDVESRATGETSGMTGKMIYS